jgi:hypothetical protein
MVEAEGKVKTRLLVNLLAMPARTMSIDMDSEYEIKCGG